MDTQTEHIDMKEILDEKSFDEYETDSSYTDEEKDENSYHEEFAEDDLLEEAQRSDKVSREHQIEDIKEEALEASVSNEKSEKRDKLEGELRNKMQSHIKEPFLEIFSLEHKQIHDEYVEKLSQINQKILELQGM